MIEKHYALKSYVEGGIGLYKSPYFKYSSFEEISTLFNAIFSNSKDGLYVCDGNGRTLVFNEAFLHISGIPEKLLYRYSVFQLVEKDYVPNSCAAVTLRTRKKHNTIIDYYNGKKAVLTSTPIFNDNNEIMCVVSNVRDITELNRLHEELEEARKINYQYKQTLSHIQGEYQRNENIIFRSKKIYKIIALADRLSKNDSPVLILGESGVGKGELAKYIHNTSGRSGAFITINCGAIPDNLLESELFGYEKGAFTGANQSKAGLIELANKGTIFLDEIGELPFQLQVKLLNVLQEQKVRRLGGTQSINVDMRIIAATNSNLEKLIEQKKFREDLYYRLNVLQIHIPPLRERIEDIPVLSIHFLNTLNEKYGTQKKIEAEAMEHLINYSWPGNVRELKNIIERIYYLSETDKITVDTLPQTIRSPKIQKQQHIFNTDKQTTLKEAVATFERKYIAQKLQESKTLKECAEKLNIDLSTLVRKKQKYGI
ncbi:PAS domain S-box-containing protein [Caldalkalibacillus uzonensis]|uniref:PAS domain S-box-containing protein n=1 Tax=Caldalkalibacillus uzonensis TaxID=353224 RepID=A0ABU0CY98_9BACI|nr:sigma 54-interacting transcriptional regulator [Caldalkalibacillus uzonensis]MDQ0341112.1 PAS domain S-box-containing protein [Caldalkalibacillus uzonensis]